MSRAESSCRGGGRWSRSRDPGLSIFNARWTLGTRMALGDVDHLRLATVGERSTFLATKTTARIAFEDEIANLIEWHAELLRNCRVDGGRFGVLMFEGACRLDIAGNGGDPVGDGDQGVSGGHCCGSGPISVETWDHGRNEGVLIPRVSRLTDTLMACFQGCACRYSLILGGDGDGRPACGGWGTRAGSDRC
jgi:hypothetical protein